MYLHVKDLAETLKWDNHKPASPAQQDLFADAAHSPQEVLIIEVLKQHPVGLHIDELSWRTRLPLTQMASSLLQLEFKKLIRSQPGKKYSLQQ